MATLPDILNFTRDELATELTSKFNLEPFRAKQIVPWVYKSRSQSFDPMTDIAGRVRTQLSEHFQISRPKIVTALQSQDGSRKYLLEVGEGHQVESVLICQPKRFTLCVSSQVGCAINCQFCRTAKMGLKRNLQASEIVGQVLAVQDDIEQLRAEDPSRRIEQFQNIVFMGMGEPLHNLEQVIRAVQILNDELGLNFSGRKVTVSTSGLVPAIEKFGASGAQANLAVSLNATTDEVRTAIMPINKRWPIATLLDTLRRYPLKKGRRITIEYVLLRGINDSRADMARLPRLLHGIPVKVNLIPYNSNTGLGFEPPSKEVILEWQNALLSKAINATIRWSKGEDISAACGQLATESSRRAA